MNLLTLASLMMLNASAADDCVPLTKTPFPFGVDGTAMSCLGGYFYGSTDPASPNFNPYHPFFDFDGDGIANRNDCDWDGDGIPNHIDPDPWSINCPWWAPCDPEDEDNWLRTYNRGSDAPPGHPCWNYYYPFGCDDDPDCDGIPNWMDDDDLNDGRPDVNNPHHPSYDPAHPDSDLDCDGIPNKDDDDKDGDGICNHCDPLPLTHPCSLAGPDTPLPDCDCDDDPGGPGGPGGPDDPQWPGNPGGGSDDPPPPTNPRPNPNPEEDTPPPPPPSVPPPPPSGIIIPPAPKDDECCEAICARLDEIIFRVQRLDTTSVAMLNALHRFIGDGDNGGLWQHFYQRMISDPDSFRNRVDDGLWTIADYLDAIRRSLASSDPDGSPPGNLTLRSWKDTADEHKADIDARLSDEQFSMPDLTGYADAGSPPVWSFSLTMPSFWSQTPPTLSYTVDWSFFASIRPLVHGGIFFLVGVQCVFIIWEELRRYG